MTMKKRIFWTNTLMVLISLTILFAVFTGSISLLKNRYLQSLEQRIELPEGLYEVQTMLDEARRQPVSWDELSAAVDAHGFRLHVTDTAAQVMYSNADEQAQRAAQTLDQAMHADEPTRVYTMEGVTVAKCAVVRDTHLYTVYAVFVSENRAFGGMSGDMLRCFLTAIVVTGVCMIAGLLLCSQRFTRLLIRRFMQPVEALHLAALRIRNGDLDQPIHYAENDEFREVCDTFDLMQRDLKERREQAAAYEKARTEMISGISHDLRTPLTSVKGFVKGLLDGVANTPEKQRQYLEISYQKACDMENLLQKLIFLSHMETGQLRPALRRVALYDWLTRYTADKQPECAARHYTLTLDADAPCAVLLDPDQMRRVLDNLVENSLKYAGAPALALTLTLRENHGQAVLTVRDNGAGLLPEKTVRVFEQFYRGDDARSSKTEGSGLGLYVCRYLIEQHGGSIAADGENGFAVTITLPLDHGEEQNDGENPDRRR